MTKFLLFYPNFLSVTAIKALRRAGYDWHTISKITGHKNPLNLVKHYDLSLEVQNLVTEVNTIFCVIRPLILQQWPQLLELVLALPRVTNSCLESWIPEKTGVRACIAVLGQAYIWGLEMGRSRVQVLAERSRVPALAGRSQAQYMTRRSQVQAMIEKSQVQILPVGNQVQALPGRSQVQALPGTS